MARKNKNARHLLLWLVFLLYIGALVYFLFFAEWYRHGPGLGGTASYNFMPFAEIGRFLSYRETLGAATVFLNLGGNVLGFMPLGALLPRLDTFFRKAARTVLTGCVLSAAVEAVQLVTGIGSCDIDDVILNTLGTALGYLLYLILRPKRSKRR